MSPYTKILVAVDASNTARVAAEHGIALARAHKAALRFLTVIDYGGFVGAVPSLLTVMHNDARLMLDGWMKQGTLWGLDTCTAVVETDPRNPRVADAIVADAREWGADLIVIGSHGRSGVRHLLLGSVAEGVARASTIPVLIVHPQHQAAP
ncbi:TRAP-T-associated universal stress protein TeaD [mine drainage metagenome]|uniref:TRAP-T-associated universal stress protein TeaD n=1 Tax=mine drainage metagenome TaxID=410659 RepID=A0A1J5QRL8_9ZZZZ